MCLDNQQDSTEVVQNIVQFNKFCKEIGTQLLAIRNEAGLTQDDISKRIGADRRKIIACEQGTGDINTILLYCDVFDIAVDFIVSQT